MEHAFDSLMSYFPIKVVVGVFMAFVLNAEAIILCPLPGWYSWTASPGGLR